MRLVRLIFYIWFKYKNIFQPLAICSDYHPSAGGTPGLITPPPATIPFCLLI
ncbi:MAG: hypothetical protein JWQ09_5634 [Segetibacter sp.]|nr:hypothetical protein [Segetibacter sp.]